MHSFAPIAGITSVSGSSVDAEAALVEVARPPRGSPARPRFDGYWCVPGSATASCIASTIGAYVGVSGSPIPSEITSTPAAFFSAILRSSCANRYGGIRSRRSTRSACSSFRKSSDERAREHGDRPAGQVHVQVLAHLDVSSPPSSAHGRPRDVAAAQHVRDGGAGRAGAGGERLADAALEDARADRGRAPARRTRRRSCGSGTARCARSRGPSAGRSSASSSVHASTRDRALRVADRDVLEAPTARPPACRARRAPSAAPPGIVLRRQASAPHVDAAGRRPGDRRADLAGGGLDREDVGVGPAAAAQVEDRLARAVARQLGLRAVGVEDRSRATKPGCVGSAQQQDPVGEDAEVAGADRAGRAPA